MVPRNAMIIIDIGHLVDHVQRELGLTHNETNDFALHWVAHQLYELGYFNVMKKENNCRIQKKYWQSNPLHMLAHNAIDVGVERHFYQTVIKPLLKMNAGDHVTYHISVLGPTLYLTVR